MRRSMSVFSPLSLRSPFTLLNDLDKYYGDWSAMPALFSEGEGFTPKVSTREGQYAYHIDVDLPGVTKDDIHMEIKDHTLRISGERKHKSETEKDGIYRCETQYGSFSRSFTVPEGVDEENISASSTDGVLEVVLPKRAREEESKTIDVH